MTKCPKCGTSVHEHDVICPLCGRPVSLAPAVPHDGADETIKAEISTGLPLGENRIVCPGCGSKNDAGAERCFLCGAGLGAAAQNGNAPDETGSPGEPADASAETGSAEEVAGAPDRADGIDGDADAPPASKRKMPLNRKQKKLAIVLSAVNGAVLLAVLVLGILYYTSPAHKAVDVLDRSNGQTVLLVDAQTLYQDEIRDSALHRAIFRREVEAYLDRLRDKALRLDGPSVSDLLSSVYPAPMLYEVTSMRLYQANCTVLLTFGDKDIDKLVSDHIVGAADMVYRVCSKSDSISVSMLTRYHNFTSTIKVAGLSGETIGRITALENRLLADLHYQQAMQAREERLWDTCLLHLEQVRLLVPDYKDANQLWDDILPDYYPLTVQKIESAVKQQRLFDAMHRIGTALKKYYPGDKALEQMLAETLPIYEAQLDVNAPISLQLDADRNMILTDSEYTTFTEFCDQLAQMHELVPDSAVIAHWHDQAENYYSRVMIHYLISSTKLSPLQPPYFPPSSSILPFVPSDSLYDAPADYISTHAFQYNQYLLSSDTKLLGRVQLSAQLGARPSYNRLRGTVHPVSGYSQFVIRAENDVLLSCWFTPDSKPLELDMKVPYNTDLAFNLYVSEGVSAEVGLDGIYLAMVSDNAP